MRNKIAIEKTHIHQDCDRLNITGSQKKFAIDKTDQEHDKIAIYETHLDSDRQNVQYISKNCERLPRGPKISKQTKQLNRMKLRKTAGETKENGIKNQYIKWR